MEDYPYVQDNLELMLSRRGFSNVVKKEENIKDVGTLTIMENPGTKEYIYTYFITPGDKVFVKKIREIIVQEEKKHTIIIVHDMPFTSDSKSTIQVNNVFVFETFSYDELMYDPISIIPRPYELYKGPAIKEVSKIPKICDCITKYYAFKPGSIVQVEDERTGIPFLYLVTKTVSDDRKR